VGLYEFAITLSAVFHWVWVVLAVLIGIGLVIFVHELGHFLVAKACGVKCEKFYLGFDVPIKLGPIALPRTLGKFQWGETEYGVGIIPLGGYVKMLGQDDNPAHAQKEAERIRIAKASTADPMAQGDSGVPGAAAEYELDPRSYPAKSVPQRMAIISAGVIMNLLFAVIFAAIAYRMGVLYEPCEIGGTSAGSPAWVDNLPTAAKIVQIEDSGQESDHLRFDWDLRQQIALRGLGEEPKPITFKLQLPGGQEERFTVVPSDRLVKRGISDFATIGVRPTDSTTLSSDLAAVPHMSAGKAAPAFAPGDRIVAVNGKKLDVARANEQGELPADDVEAALAANLARPVTVVVERAKDADVSPGESETLEMTLPPQPLRSVGLVMRIGPVEAVRKDSPAARAGVRIGDVIQRLNGQAIGDPLVLPQQIEQRIGQTLRLEVERPTDKDRATIELLVNPEPRYQYDWASIPSALVSAESIGIAYSVRNEVAGVAPGSPAAKAGMQPRDLLHSAAFVATTEEASKTAKQLFGRSIEREIEFDEKQENWPHVSALLQMMPEGADLELGFVRSGQEMMAKLKPVPSQQWFYVDRGLRFLSLKRIHTAASWSEAWRLGWRETKEKLQQVLNFLGKLVTLRVSPKTLGGPLMIAAAAGSEASLGTPRLLLFLTLLSANLAILNFLPIPALDGGHIMFLTAEAVTGKPVDERLQGTLTLIGVVCLLGLMVFVFANDIGRLFL
jgi:regulator of sigma E protease